MGADVAPDAWADDPRCLSAAGRLPLDLLPGRDYQPEDIRFRDHTNDLPIVHDGQPTDLTSVCYAGQTIEIAQCNNVFIFPGVGLGVIATNARRVTDAIFVAAAEALSAESPTSWSGG